MTIKVLQKHSPLSWRSWVFSGSNKNKNRERHQKTLMVHGSVQYVLQAQINPPVLNPILGCFPCLCHNRRSKIRKQNSLHFTRFLRRDWKWCFQQQQSISQSYFRNAFRIVYTENLHSAHRMVLRTNNCIFRIHH